jgi:hypothetical protein
MRHHLLEPPQRMRVPRLSQRPSPFVESLPDETLSRAPASSGPRGTMRVVGSRVDPHGQSSAAALEAGVRRESNRSVVVL